MKILFLVSLLFSLNSFALHVNEMTGSFGDAADSKTVIGHVNEIYGSYLDREIGVNRLPASIEEDEYEMRSAEVNSLTGSFE